MFETLARVAVALGMSFPPKSQLRSPDRVLEPQTVMDPQVSADSLWPELGLLRSVGVRAAEHPYDGDASQVFIDAVDHAVGASSSAVPIIERWA